MLPILAKFANQYKCSNSKEYYAALAQYYKRSNPLPGYCDAAGTLKFSQIDNKIDASHWRTPKFLGQNLLISSLGLGTQSGEPTPESDLQMFSTIATAIKSGRINAIDTDINFRFGKSQKTINAVLNYLQNQHNISRNSIFIATKCGYVPNDIDSNLDQKAFAKILIDQNYISKDDIVNQIHCMHPNFIQFSVQKSLLTLGLETIDLLYLNNPTQSQQTVIGKKEYFVKLQRSFQCLEELRKINKIRYYGIASFVSFRSPPNQQGIHADLLEIVELAKKVGGNNHGLRFILVPFNLGMPEILMKWQISSQKTQEHIFKIAQQTNININLCCPLFQGRVVNLPFQSQLLNNMKNNSAKHLQLVRSIPKQSVVTTFFSTQNVAHLEDNLQTVYHRVLNSEQWRKVLPV